MVAMTVSRRSTIKAIGVVSAGTAVSGTALAVQEDDLEVDDDDELEDEDDLGAIRFAHFSTDAPAVDVYVDEQLVLEDLDYNEVSEYLEIEPGSYQFTITAAGDQDTVVFDQQATVDPTYYTAVAIGELGDEVADEDEDDLDDEPELEEPVDEEEPTDDEPVDAEFEVLLLVDRTPEELQDETTEIRFIHASPNAPPVDVSDTETGQVIYEDIPFGQPTGYVPREPGEITLEVFPADEDDADDPAVEELGDEPDDELTDDEVADDALDEQPVEDEPIAAPEPVLSETIEFEEGLPYTVFAIGLLDDTAEDDPATEVEPDTAAEDDRPLELTAIVDGTEDEVVDDDVDAEDELEPEDDDVLEEPDDEELEPEDEVDDAVEDPDDDIGDEDVADQPDDEVLEEEPAPEQY